MGRIPEKNKIKIKKLLEKEVEDILSKKKVKRIVCIADGAHEIWIYFKKKFPDAIHITDFFHVAEHLAKLSVLLFNNTSESKAWYAKYTSILKNDPQNILNLRALILSNRWERFWDYFLHAHFPEIIT